LSDNGIRRSRLVVMLQPDQIAEANGLSAHTKFIPAVKRVQQFTGLSLKDSKRPVDAVRSQVKAFRSALVQRAR
jgi:hypothetical protein